MALGCGTSSIVGAAIEIGVIVTLMWLVMVLLLLLLVMLLLMVVMMLLLLVLMVDLIKIQLIVLLLGLMVHLRLMCSRLPQLFGIGISPLTIAV